MGASESKPALLESFKTLESSIPDEAFWKNFWSTITPETVFENFGAEAVRNVKEKNPAALVTLLQQV